MASTVAPVISKSYYNDPDQSYPYYTIYDDDVSIYKDDGKIIVYVNRLANVSMKPSRITIKVEFTIKVMDGIFRLDYNQYTVNQSVPVQPSVKISEVNTKQYQKPKKVAVNEADKYNLNQDVTAQDYDIYENQVEWKASN